MYQSLEKFSLRKINYVKTRTTILKTAASLLKQEDFNDITVDEICQKALISRGTFFNYFSTKEHIFHYYLRIFTVKVALRMREWPENLTFEEKINHIYTWFKEDRQYPHFMDNYINFILNVGEEKNEMKLIDAEFVYFFNGIKEDEYVAYNELTLNKLFIDICKEAKAKDEIKVDLTEKELSDLFTGVLTGTYISNHVGGQDNYLKIFNKIWN